jgi:hypothetical protein
MIGLLMVWAIGNLTPRDRAFAVQAQRCGIEIYRIAVVKDAKGHRYWNIMHEENPDRASIAKMRCLSDWGKRTGTKITFDNHLPIID